MKKLKKLLEMIKRDSVDLEKLDQLASKVVSFRVNSKIGDACEDDCDCIGDPDSCGEGPCPIG